MLKMPPACSWWKVLLVSPETCSTELMHMVRKMEDIYCTFCEHYSMFFIQ
jgi:hypothetical protein